MGKLIVEMYGNPVLFVITLLCFLGFVGMTYEFILKLFGKPPSDLHSVILTAGKGKEDDEEEDDDIVKVNDVAPDPNDEFEEKEEDEDEEKKDNYDNPFKRI